jgi:hypothetical protein
LYIVILSIMKLRELKNENGLLSGLIIPAEDFTELKESIKSGTAFFQYLDRLLSGQEIQDSISQPILPNGLTIAETNNITAIATERLYMDAFDKQIPMFYRDGRLKNPKEFIRANPDGSEDLVSYDIEKRDYTLVKKLMPPGKGYWSYLIPA